MLICRFRLPHPTQSSADCEPSRRHKEPQPCAHCGEREPGGGSHLPASQCTGQPAPDSLSPGHRGPCPPLTPHPPTSWCPCKHLWSACGASWEGTQGPQAVSGALLEKQKIDIFGVWLRRGVCNSPLPSPWQRSG